MVAQARLELKYLQLQSNICRLVNSGGKRKANILCFNLNVSHPTRSWDRGSQLNKCKCENLRIRDCYFHQLNNKKHSILLQGFICSFEGWKFYQLSVSCTSSRLGLSQTILRLSDPFWKQEIPTRLAWYTKCWRVLTKRKREQRTDGMFTWVND